MEQLEFELGLKDVYLPVDLVVKHVGEETSKSKGRREIVNFTEHQVQVGNKVEMSFLCRQESYSNSGLIGSGVLFQERALAGQPFLFFVFLATPHGL